jgi:hypothetical protein
LKQRGNISTFLYFYPFSDVQSIRKACAPAVGTLIR